MTKVLRYPPDLRALDGSNTPLPYVSIDIINFRERNFVYDKGEANLISSSKEYLASVILPLPENGVTNSYSMNWEMANTQGIKVIEALSKGNIREAGAGVSAIVAGGVFRRIANKTPNPKKQALFDGIEPRSFTLEYVFFPQSRQEVDILGKVIRTLTSYALPELSEAEYETTAGEPTNTETENTDNEFVVFDRSAFFEFPSEFEITYRNVKGFPKYNPAVCTSISTNYGSQLQLFESGHSIQINLSMSFLETEFVRRGRPGV